MSELDESEHPPQIKGGIDCGNPDCPLPVEVSEVTEAYDLPIVGQTFECGECGELSFVVEVEGDSYVRDQYDLHHSKMALLTHDLLVVAQFKDVIGSLPDEKLVSLYKQGLTRTTAIDYHVVENAGVSQQEWADRTDRSQQAISENIIDAREKLTEGLRKSRDIPATKIFVDGIDPMETVEELSPDEESDLVDPRSELSDSDVKMLIRNWLEFFKNIAWEEMGYTVEGKDAAEYEYHPSLGVVTGELNTPDEIEGVPQYTPLSEYEHDAFGELSQELVESTVKIAAKCTFQQVDEETERLIREKADDPDHVLVTPTSERFSLYAGSKPKRADSTLMNRHAGSARNLSGWGFDGNHNYDHAWRFTISDGYPDVATIAFNRDATEYDTKRLINARSNGPVTDLEDLSLGEFKAELRTYINTFEKHSTPHFGVDVLPAGGKIEIGNLAEMVASVETTDTNVSLLDMVDNVFDIETHEETTRLYYDGVLIETFEN